MTKVFVYGSLMQGFWNHRLLKEAGEPTPATVEGTLFAYSTFPAFAIQGQTKVEGEVYSVTPAILARLDALEGEGHFYHRRPLVAYDRKGKRIEVEVYTMPLTVREIKERFEIIESGSFREWASRKGDRQWFN